MTQLTYMISIMIPLIISLLAIVNPCNAVEITVSHFLTGDIFGNPPGTCLPGTGNYTLGSAYDLNLSTAFSNLTAAAAASNKFNATAGSGRDKVYTSFYCDSNVKPSDCLACVQNATASIPEKCTRKSAIVYSNDCQVWYANKPMFSQDNRASLLSCDREGSRIPDPNGSLNQTVTSMLERLVEQVALSGGYLQSSVEAADWIIDQKVYAAVWCIPVVNREGCVDCLSRGVNETRMCLSKGATLGVNRRPNCWMRYDLHPFGDFFSPAPAPAPVLEPALSPSASSNSLTSPYSRGSRSALWIMTAGLILTKNFIAL